MRSSSSTQSTVTSTQHNPALQTNFTSVDIISITLAIAFPAVVLLSILVHRKYQAVILRRQIDRLNRIWRLDPSKNLSY